MTNLSKPEPQAWIEEWDECDKGDGLMNSEMGDGDGKPSETD